MDKIEDKSKKVCCNCEYFLPHYIIKNYSARKSRFGHCTNNKKINPEPCKHWTKQDFDNNQVKESLKKILQKMSNRLDQISIAINKID